MPCPSEFQFVRLTAGSRGAIACFAVWGGSALNVVSSLVDLANRRSSDDLQPGEFRYARWKQGPLVGEDIIVARPDATFLELHCHGSPLGTELIARMLSEHGGRPATQRDYLLASGLDWWQATTHQQWLLAPTRRTSEIIGSMKPRWPLVIRRLQQHIEQNRATAAIDQIDAILRWWDFGRHLTEPWRVILCGKPNVGKSSLINRLAGFQRAVVHDQPGTTRDRVSHHTALDGWPVELTDTAGLRGDSSDPIETAGIELARREIEESDLTIAVFDASQPWTSDDRAFWERELSGGLLVWNKIDLATSKQRPDGLSVSAVTGAGIETLIEFSVQRLVPELPGPEDLVPVLDEQQERLIQIRCLLVEQRFDAALKLLAEPTSDVSPDRGPHPSHGS